MKKIQKHKEKRKKKQNIMDYYYHLQYNVWVNNDFLTSLNF
jgi:hypothetical protein